MSIKFCLLTGILFIFQRIMVIKVNTCWLIDTYIATVLTWRVAKIKILDPWYNSYIFAFSIIEDSIETIKYMHLQ